MQLNLIDPALIRGLANTNGKVAEGQLEFVFDDPSLDPALFGTGREQASAHVFGAAQRYIHQIHAALQEGDYEALVAHCAELAASGCPLTTGSCWEIASILKCVVPQVPNPVLRVELGPLRPLLENIWETAIEKRETALQKHSGAPLYRWYEHRGMYEEARRVLNSLVEISASRQEFCDEAVSRNNLGFEYLLEGRFEEAMDHFEKAANIFEEVGDIPEHANSRANYWICLFERDEMGDIRRAEIELERLAESLTQYHFWQARKPFILLARISERRGGIRKAVDLVRKAIRCADGSGTRYPEADAEYLRLLEAKLETQRSRRRPGSRKNSTTRRGRRSRR